ncbi:hypothetical protein Ddc_15412 [Ditylenchus destructor]|nr:hypothetical protein Ddc_15412 [Ditylenchus destructor]
MVDMNIVLVMILFLLPLSAANEDHDKVHKDEHKSDEVTIHGNVRIYLHDDDHEDLIVWVYIKSADPGKKNEYKALAKCGKAYPLDYFMNAKGHTCSYTIKNYDKGKAEKIEVGAEFKNSWTAKFTNKIAWSKPLSIPENHEINFVYDVRGQSTLPTIYLEGLIEVHLSGVIHLKLPKKSAFFYKYYKVPDHVTVWVRQESPIYHFGDHHRGESPIKSAVKESRKCSTHKSDAPHECHYSVPFYVREEGDLFEVTAKVQRGKYAHAQDIYGPHAAFTPKQRVPESDDMSHEVVMDFVLEFPKDEKKAVPVIHLDNLDQHKNDIRNNVVKKKGKKT